MKMRSVIISTLLLTACNGGMAPIDSQEFLGGLAGPKVPSMTDTMTESALSAEKSGDFKQASQIYLQILEKKPDDLNIQLALADSYRRSGEIDKSLPIYDGIIAKDPMMIAAKESKALALIAKSDFDAPVKLLSDVLEVDATRWKTLNAMGILFTTRNMHSEAQQYFTEALKFHQDSPTVLNNLGLSQALSRNYNDAISTLTKASVLTPKGSFERKRVDLNLALVYAAAGKLEDAKFIAQQYLSGAALNNNLGMYAHLAKDDQMSKAYLNMALTESKVFYEKAWENLQDVSGKTASPEAKPVRRKVKPAKKPVIPVMPPLPASSTDSKAKDVAPQPAPSQGPASSYPSSSFPTAAPAPEATTPPPVAETPAAPLATPAAPMNAPVAPATAAPITEPAAPAAPTAPVVLIPQASPVTTK